ncbi:DUF1223 domain-containing protein [Methylobacillus flagellatus]|uniref:DUF1223 domain-containing protein n=1 Tax=Methylobacillus flagellatus TaxID=405 RepID=UPI0010F86957|nr:DUF1223 domain-containing protein [Methylobacillus flagellatus]
MRPLSSLNLITLSLLALPLIAQTGLAYAECSATSGDQRVPLVELYTSEGCSSCPPADKWLNSLRSSGFDQNKVIPLAFHVDYWDYIGWKDPYASPRYSARQRVAAARGGAGFVYTPQIMLNGRDYRGWSRDSQFTRDVNGTLKQAARARLGIRVSQLPSGELGLKTSASVAPGSDAKQAELFVAVYENNLRSSIKAGENAGRELTHDHVVREWMGPFSLDTADKTLEKLLILNASWQQRDAGIVVFVQDRANGDVLQALAMPLCKS